MSGTTAGAAVRAPTPDLAPAVAPRFGLPF
jgi:hypothetical protein